LVALLSLHGLPKRFQEALVDDYLEKRDWTLGISEPKEFWKRRRWRRARKCVNCNGAGYIRVTGWLRDWPCPDCHTRGYYQAGQLYSDSRSWLTH
jgi:hypothetical protein